MAEVLEGWVYRDAKPARCHRCGKRAKPGKSWLVVGTAAGEEVVHENCGDAFSTMVASCLRVEHADLDDQVIAHVQRHEAPDGTHEWWLVMVPVGASRRHIRWAWWLMCATAGASLEPVPISPGALFDQVAETVGCPVTGRVVFEL